ncbi:MAG: GldG family protein [Treponema sp.]|jgi:ABC-type uncharacterized transport system involved in gliding motility auxiliary subunit|nr:GldG family protein [Treponema sp.]
MNRRQYRIISVLTIAALALAILVTGRLWFRVDLTRNKAYTLSEVSRKLCGEIADQVRITYFVSDRLAAIHPMPGEIEDLLREYAAASRGKIRFMVRDPAKANMIEAVESVGIQSRQIEIVEKDEASVATVYSGVLIEYLDRAEVLPVVFAPDTLEYDVSSRIGSLIRDRERELGVIVGDSYRQWNNEYGYAAQIFQQAGYRVRLINPGDEIPDTLPVLLVLGGAEELDHWALYRIDRYLQGGGRIIFALESVYVNSAGGFEARAVNDGGLLEMVASYGAALRKELVLDRSANTIRYETVSGGGMRQINITRYPLWIGIIPENGNAAHPVSAYFRGADLFWASPVELTPPPGVEGEFLFTSTETAWTMKDTFSVGPDTPWLLEQNAGEAGEKKIMAAALSGTFPSYFRDKPKPEREGAELPELPAAAVPSRIIVVGDTDLASVFIQYTQDGRNLDFLLQAADWMGNDDDIIGIRSRETGTGRLDRIIDPVKKAGAAGWARILNMVLVPLLVIGAGLFFAWKRRTGAGVSAGVPAGVPGEKERS